jgi:hypothetical protein
MSWPSTGWMPCQCWPEAPLKRPSGMVVSMLVRPVLRSLGWLPSRSLIWEAKTATSVTRMMPIPPAIATLSCLSRRQAIWRSERPWIAFSSSCGLARSLNVTSSSPCWGCMVIGPQASFESRDLRSADLASRKR